MKVVRKLKVNKHLFNYVKFAILKDNNMNTKYLYDYINQHFNLYLKENLDKLKFEINKKIAKYNKLKSEEGFNTEAIYIEEYYIDLIKNKLEHKKALSYVFNLFLTDFYLKN